MKRKNQSNTTLYSINLSLTFILCCITFILLLLMSTEKNSIALARIKDIAEIVGVRENQLIGYGLVVGLDGTGDDDDSPFTYQSIVNMMKNLGITVKYDDIDVDNVAGVMVTAELPPFARAGTKIDVIVSSLGNAKSLQGGVLLMTPLRAANGEVYAVAQGPVSIGGFNIRGGGRQRVQKNHPTVGRIPEGAIIERNVKSNLCNKSKLRLTLRDPDFTTAERVENAINANIGLNCAIALDASTIDLIIPPKFKKNIVAFVSTIENITVEPDSIAKVIINERTGTVVMGEHVRISTVAVSHGNLTISIKEKPKVSQPKPLSKGKTVVKSMRSISVEEGTGKIVVVPQGARIGDVAKGLNAIGAAPRDIIAIFQAIKQAGALQAELKIL